MGGYAAYKDIETMNLKDRLDEALKRIERLSLALTRIECECSGEYAAQIAHAALYGQNQGSPTHKTPAVTNPTRLKSAQASHFPEPSTYLALADESDATRRGASNSAHSLPS